MKSIVIALIYGLVCQSSFLCAVYLMALSLHGELYSIPFVATSITERAAWDFLLLLQFPLIHSVFLSQSGRRLLSRLAPGGLGPQLAPTTFVAIASMQLIALFLLWAHTGAREWRPHGAIASAWEITYALSWVALAVSMVQAGISTQMGFLGWTSVVRGVPVSYPSFPRGGLYKICRHPVYFSMALVSSTGPVWNLDHAIIASVFVTYCVVGPKLKERRLRKQYGESFSTYSEATPFFPTPQSVLRFLRPV